MYLPVDRPLDRETRNYRPRRGERRYCPANFDVDISATLSLISFFPIVFFVFLGIIRPKQILIPSRTFFPVLPTSRWGRYFSPQQLRCSFTEDKDRHTYQTDPRFERRSMGLVWGTWATRLQSERKFHTQLRIFFSRLFEEHVERVRYNLQ